jgi:hypothetical protein
MAVRASIAFWCPEIRSESRRIEAPDAVMPVLQAPLTYTLINCINVFFYIRSSAVVMVASQRLRNCALGVLILLAMASPAPAAAEEQAAAPQEPDAELLWDYREPGGALKANNLHPFAGSALPDGGFVLLALWNER